MLRECVVCSTAAQSVSTALSSAYFFFFSFFLSQGSKMRAYHCLWALSSWAWKSCGINFRDWALCLIFHNLETGFMSNCRKQFSQIYTRAQEWLTVLAHAASLGMRDVCVYTFSPSALIPRLSSATESRAVCHMSGHWQPGPRESVFPTDFIFSPQVRAGRQHLDSPELSTGMLLSALQHLKRG